MPPGLSLAVARMVTAERAADLQIRSEADYEYLRLIETALRGERGAAYAKAGPTALDPRTAGEGR